MGPAVKSAYLPQLVSFENPERDMVETMLYEAKCDAQTARDRLAAFGFRGEDVFKTVSFLSGGEQSRLRLCILMRDDINFLLLDEPPTTWTSSAGSGWRTPWPITARRCCS